jgi:hypothetical protein
VRLPPASTTPASRESLARQTATTARGRREVGVSVRERDPDPSDELGVPLAHDASKQSQGESRAQRIVAVGDAAVGAQPGGEFVEGASHTTTLTRPAAVLRRRDRPGENSLT